MGTLKIGPAEEKVIEEIERFKATYEPQLKKIHLGIELIAQQLPNNEVKEIQDFKCQIKSVMEIVSRVTSTVTGIHFSEKCDEEKFSVEWTVYKQKNNYYQWGYYGKTKSPITEKQFLHAICSWEKEVCNSITLFRKIGGYSCDSICSDMEQQIHQIIYEYVNPKET